MPEQRHEALVEQLAAIRTAQKQQQKAFLQYIRDPQAPEKISVQNSISKLIEMIPDTMRLSALTRSAVVERIVNANELGEKMTAKVREIDKIKSRVQLFASNASQIIEFRNAFIDFEAAMRQRNYEQAAHYLLILKETKESNPDVTDRMRLNLVEEEWKRNVHSLFTLEIARKEYTNLQSIAPILRVFGEEYQITLYEEWAMTEKERIKAVCQPRLQGRFSNKELIQQLTEIFNCVAGSIQESEQMLLQIFCEIDGLERFTKSVYEMSELVAARILQRYIQQRDFKARMTSTLQSTKRIKVVESLKKEGKQESVETEFALWNEQLDEMALLLQYTQTFERFMHLRIEPLDFKKVDTDRKSSEIATQQCELRRTVQELAGFYCYFEDQLLTQAASQAFSWEETAYTSNIATAQNASNTAVSILSVDNATFPVSSAVDEIFYVAKNSAVRSLATGHIDCAAGALNIINTVLRDTFGTTMRQRIRRVPSQLEQEGRYIGQLAEASTQLRDQVQHQMHQKLAQLSKTTTATFGVSTNAAMMLGRSGTNTPPTELIRKEQRPEVVMNSLEQAIEYLNQIANQLETSLPQYFGDSPDHIMTCLQGFEDSRREFEQLLNAGRKNFVQELKPKLKGFLSPLLSPASKRPVLYELSDEMYTFNEANDPFAQEFVRSVRQLIVIFQGNLSTSNQSQLARIFGQCVAEWIEDWFDTNNTRFNQLGALQFDKDLRILSSFFSEWNDGDDPFGKLAQISCILNVDTISDVVDIAGSIRRGTKWLLSSAQVKEILSRRVEFTDKEINNLTLS
uniref:Conserved oligomeric Golgi complex subunit 4 n=1 Tax=Albugo laibachii Nc14 TaxID=890382 RepID=F0WI58_9STRA|nr:conserved oligomeric Golgi complex subunit putative [Albugo laibachii Nc14]|eukprot:CCA20936.1 conserved oligomeric Golgi complex subunit putative [Albugo laibachii Nc14]